MRKIFTWQVTLGLGLAALSALLYSLHYFIFGDAHHIFIYMLGDVAFIPLEVLLITMIIHKLLSARERQQTMEKMNMVIGAFFSETGTGLIKSFLAFDRDSSKVGAHLLFSPDWNDADFTKAFKNICCTEPSLDSRSGDLAALKSFLSARKDFMLRLLENPTLLEHESFTDLLWAVFHLTAELEARPSLEGLPDADLDHLSGDMKRAYGRLLVEWIAYLKHLKKAYPFLYSLALRTNPMNPQASPVVKA